MNMLRPLCSAVIALCAGAAGATGMGFKAAPFGATEAEVHKLGKLHCVADRLGLADRRCMFDHPSDRTFAGHYSDELWLNFIGGRLDSFTGQFRPAAFDAIRDAMQQRYGVGECVTSPAPACAWNVPEGEAVLLHRGRAVHLDVGSASGKAERLRRLGQAQAKSRRDV